MNLAEQRNKFFDFFDPFGRTIEEILPTVREVVIVAHQDDVAIAASPALLADNQRVLGITVTNGSGSPRAGSFAELDGEAMASIRLQEERTAAKRGGYAALQLGFSSAEVKLPTQELVTNTLIEIFGSAHAVSVVRTHSLFDLHPTHVAVAVRVIQSLRYLEVGYRPKSLYGGEVWGGVGHLPAEILKYEDVSRLEHLIPYVLSSYASQVEGGKNYVAATVGRLTSNATFSASHAVDTGRLMATSVDMTELIIDTEQPIARWVERYLRQTTDAASKRISDVID